MGNEINALKSQIENLRGRLDDGTVEEADVAALSIRLDDIEKTLIENPKVSPNWIKAVNEQFSQIQRRLTPLEAGISQEAFDHANRKFNETLERVTGQTKEQAGEIHALAKLVKALTQELIALKSGKAQEPIERVTKDASGKQEVELAFKQAAEASRVAWTNRIRVGSWMTCTKAAIACGCTANAIRKWAMRHAMSRRRVTGHHGKGILYEYWIPNTKLKTAPKLKGPSIAGSKAQQARRERERLERLAQRREALDQKALAERVKGEEPVAQIAADLGNQHATD